MKMGIDINVYVDGVVESLSTRHIDDVDAEGTMIAKYVDPIIAAATADEFGGPFWVGDDQIIIDPWRIVALDFTVFEWKDLTSE